MARCLYARPIDFSEMHLGLKGLYRVGAIVLALPSVDLRSKVCAVRGKPAAHERALGLGGAGLRAVLPVSLNGRRVSPAQRRSSAMAMPDSPATA